MEYKYSKFSDLEIFIITVSGTPGKDTRKVVHLKTLEAFNNSNYYKMLIDISSTKTPKKYTLHNSLDLSVFLNKIETKKHIKIAFHNKYEENEEKVFEQLSQLITKRQIKLFTNYDEAINWLRDDKKTVNRNNKYC